ncbi:uncharacterized protein TRUGW13939_07077 [Talaromyces rugulosus]|uniref:Uncharacterized protein n=1 Tax=Talaromyces rugulosus TaxID=121627 RepID=A0A7H8R2J4_TALRU|nr:uncharacterized protein TRUGW13939_07077 [Talaromyces rugulosus]QKX59935.1 hypothetical protein TRUGW13939_07077 [Talaromyces rugulosus]
MVLEYENQIQRAEYAESTTPASSVRDSDKLKAYIPLAGLSDDGWSKDNEATATCYCGAVQLAFVSPYSLEYENPQSCSAPIHLKFSPPSHLLSISPSK